MRRSMGRKLLFLLVGVTFLIGFKKLIYMNERYQFTYTSTLEKAENLSSSSEIRMDDPRVIEKIRKSFLVPPAPSSTPYVLKNPSVIDTSMGQAERIRSILGELKGGFFIECGALDGETRSNTLYFERYLNWTGLLIEADPLNFELMITKNRKAYMSSSCLSIKPYPMMVSFKQAFNVGKISNYQPGNNLTGYVNVQCFPLYSYLLALNIKTVNYLSLDVEGYELDVLRTIPFDKIDIQTMSVEFIHGVEGKDVMQKFVTNQGYILHSEVTHEHNQANDFIFVKSSILQEP